MLKKSRRNGTKIVVAMVITYLLMVGIVIYFLSSNEKSKEGMQLLKEQYNSGVIIEETDDVKIVAKTNKKQEGISVKEYNILIRNDFSLREKIHSLHYSILDKNIAVSDFVRTDYKYIKDDVKKDFETGYAAKGGLEFMAWYSKRALVPVYTVVKIEFEGDSKEIEELKICYEMEE